MSLSRRNPRRDAAEKTMVSTARSIGALVWQLSGNGLPDLLILFRARFFVVECKSAGGTLTKAQEGIPWPVVRTPSELLQVIGAIK